VAVEVLLLRSDPIYFLNDRKNVEKAKGSAAVLGTVKGVRSGSGYSERGPQPQNNW